MEKLNLLLLAFMVMSHSALSNLVIQVKQEVGLGDSQPCDLEEGGDDTATDDSTIQGITTTTEPPYCGKTLTEMDVGYGLAIYNCTTKSVEEAKEFCASKGSAPLMSENPGNLEEIVQSSTNLVPGINGFWINAKKVASTWSWAVSGTIPSDLIESSEKDALYAVYQSMLMYKGQDSTDMTEHFVICAYTE